MADPDAAKPGVGALLLRSYLAGPQDVTTTDGATDERPRDVERARGRDACQLASIGWTVVFAPARSGRRWPSAAWARPHARRAAAPIAHAVAGGGARAAPHPP